jgi:hypothetical protein
MKKLLLTLFLLLLSNTANAWEATVGLGGYGRIFDEKDQLGAVSKHESLIPEFSGGLALNGSFLFDASPSFRIGPDLMLGYGWLSAQANENFGSSLQNQTIITSLNVQYQIYDFRVSVKPGFVVNTLTAGYTDKIDSDTGFSSSIRFSTDLFSRGRFFFEPQVLFSPSVESKNSFVPSYSLTLGFEKIFSSKKIVVPVIEKPVEVKPVVKTPEPVVEPVKLPEPATVVNFATVVKLPEPSTPTKLSEQDVKLEEKKVEPPVQILPKSYLENILKTQKSLQTPIKISYSKDEYIKTKVDSLVSWFVERGLKKENIILSDKLKTKGIKIDILKK